MELGPVEARIVGCLLEKELATPQQYPLTLNALVAACNQSTNRDPVVDYDDSTVEAALADLKERRLVRFVHPSHGRSALRYRQVLDEVLGLDASDRALVAVLLLRGPQTAAELRARTERMAQWESAAEVEAALVRLSQRTEPLVRQLGRRPGQKEVRWVQLLSARAEAADDATSMPAPGPVSTPQPGVAELRDAVDDLRAEVADLRAELGVLRDSLGG